MPISRGLSKAYVVLEAVRLASDAQFPQLQQLVARQPHVLTLELVLRILLTYLPESTELDVYTGFLHELVKGSHRTTTDDAEDCFNIPQEISELEARQRVRHLRLLPLAEPHRFYDQSVDTFTLFLLHRAFRIDAETGSIPLVAQLVEPFLSHSSNLRTWAVSTLLPLLRLHYQYYPNDGPVYSLESFEKLRGNGAVKSLLSKAAQTKSEAPNTVIGRDLRGLVGPWMYGQNINKRRKVENTSRRGSSVGIQTIPEDNGTNSEAALSSSWADVNDWLLELATMNHAQAVEVVEQWDGPKDVDDGGWRDPSEYKEDESLQALQKRYGQAGLSAAYATSSSTLETIVGSYRILHKVAKLLNLPFPPDLENPNSSMIADMPNGYFESLFPSHLLHNALLRADSPLTSPTSSAISLLYLLLASAYIMQSYGDSKACRNLLDLAAFGDEANQLAELRKLLHTIQSNPRAQLSWDSIRHQILWLYNWGYQAGEGKRVTAKDPRGLFCKVRAADVETELLKAMLASSYYNHAVDIYCKTKDSPLPQTVVERTALDVALAFYDSASNGNRNRGDVRKASEIISTFGVYFQDSKPFKRVNALLTATHSMSFYSLTLQHGVPLQPVNIRAHKDPMLLVGKILEQNPRSYTKLDDLLDIGQNLVLAGVTSVADDDDHDPISVPKDSLEEQALLAKRRVTAMAIDAALRENDFDTAYSYVVNRLSPPSTSPSTSVQPSTLHDDISWRAAYNAGRYKPTSQPSGPSALRRLEQRMELLSQALLLAPPPSLTEILTVWRTCEEDLNVVFANEAAEEEKWNTKGDRYIPGSFTKTSVPSVQKTRESSRAAMAEEAPMGLLDVAKGAASALSKNAFPLRSPRLGGGSAGSLQSPHERSLSKMGSGGSDSGSGTDHAGEGRVRKRDMVSNMVTGGLASGIGWVIGAPPVKPEE